ncbi:HAD family hydrolase [Streptomyces sp. NPDC001848]|uniref:HAD family hydrolase n=1 Tax=Streptomyces sp. NPDC001848 TaxID=3364618 RepID=UPI0036A3C68D
MVTGETGDLREVITQARCVLFDFDGPICRLFAGYSADKVAKELVDWLTAQGLLGLLTQAESDDPDPHVVLRTVDVRHPGSDLVTELEEILTQHELRAVPLARPTPYADPLIRTWTAVGVRLAVTTNNSALVAGRYLESRGLTECFARHVYGRTRDLRRMKPDPHCLNQALTAMGARPADALMIGDTVSDLLAADSAGVPFVGYAPDERRDKVLRAAGAQYLVSSLEPLLGFLRARRGDR